MPDDASDAAYRLAVACALVFAVASVKRESSVVAATWTLSARARTREFSSALRDIRQSATTRALSTLTALAIACSVTKPTKRSFERWFSGFTRDLMTPSADAEDERSGGWRAWRAKARKAFRTYARATLDDGERGAMRGMMRKVSNAMTGGEGRVTTDDWVVARTCTVEDKAFFVGVLGLWWGPIPTVSRAKKGMKGIADAYGEQIIAMATSGR